MCCYVKPLAWSLFKHEDHAVAPPLYKGERTSLRAPPVLKVEWEQILVHAGGRRQHLHRPLVRIVRRHSERGKKKETVWSRPGFWGCLRCIPHEFYLLHGKLERNADKQRWIRPILPLFDPPPRQSIVGALHNLNNGISNLLDQLIWHSIRITNFCLRNRRLINYLLSQYFIRRRWTRRDAH